MMRLSILDRNTAILAVRTTGILPVEGRRARCPLAAQARKPVFLI
jgi:hypothetical protein